MSGQVPDTSNQEIRAALALVAMRLDSIRREFDAVTALVGAAVTAAYREPMVTPQPTAPPDDTPRGFGDYPDD